MVLSTTLIQKTIYIDMPYTLGFLVLMLWKESG